MEEGAQEIVPDGVGEMSCRNGGGRIYRLTKFYTGLTHKTRWHKVQVTFPGVGCCLLEFLQCFSYGTVDSRFRMCDRSPYQVQHILYQHIHRHNISDYQDIPHQRSKAIVAGDILAAVKELDNFRLKRGNV